MPVGGYNYTTDLLVGENGLAKALLKFDHLSVRAADASNGVTLHGS